MAICNHAMESQKLDNIHRAGVYVCSMPGGPTLHRLTKFENQIEVLSFDLLLDVLDDDAWVHINLPEICIGEFIECGSNLVELQKRKKYSFNVMLQNIDFIPSRKLIERIKSLGVVTLTTAHKAYCNEGTAKLLGVAIWHWSVWVSPEKYKFVKFEDKENLIVYSPDENPFRKKTLEALFGGLPGFKFKEIRGIKFEEYKAIIGRAKFSLTFGEGLDGYFVEPIFSGSIGCAVYNERFFTSEYRALPFVYDSWSELISVLPNKLLSLGVDEYVEAQSRQFEVIARNYAHVEYVANLKTYYTDLMLLVSAFN